MFQYKVTFYLMFISLYAYADCSKVKKSFPSADGIPECSTTLRSSPKFRLQEQYDIIVLGAGAAGSIISAKLASNLSNMSILLVEAGVETGNNDNDNITNPALWLYVVHNDTLEWRFQTVPQTALNNRVIDLGFAKGTGGGAMHNAMGYVRGGQKWMDAWELDEGATNWNSETLTPYFDAVEDILKVVYPANDTQGLVDAIFEASRTAGFPYNPSYNHGPDMLGIANFVMSINDADKTTKQRERDPHYTRVTSYQKYLENHISHNLQLVTGLQAIGFNFSDGEVPVVDHVELYSERHQCKFSIAAKKDLILSMGAINTPKLLQLSGIGNATHLQSLGIKVVKDLPGVGMNLRDDVVVNLVFKTTAVEIDSPPASFLSAVLFAVDNSTAQSVSYRNGTGSLTNIEMLFSTGNMIGNSWPIEWQNSIVLSPNIQQCKSRGTVMIESLDPLAFPTIDPAYLTVDADFDRVLNSILLGRELLSQPSFFKWNIQEVLPGPDYTTRDELIEWIRTHATTGFHYIGTCKMGTDKLSVVDPLNMKVWGIDGLRIIDASVAPASFSANTQSLTYAVAARAVDLILAEYNNKK
ncbi:unnamed protein product [Adineta ricciae]|uniref:Glucose-methanol-choline oxidoreductase N-terminal domain-containing protein n=1 Tax=Adineta ricciae TaxID=249248 RepID=A0A814Y3R3_ADIRI|nr:unnamed protein product [Adineta ricciae]CAF1224800.1 unnamed protein product [Adineta ricciae]